MESRELQQNIQHFSFKMSMHGSLIVKERRQMNVFSNLNWMTQISWEISNGLPLLPALKADQKCCHKMSLSSAYKNVVWCAKSTDKHAQKKPRSSNVKFKHITEYTKNFSTIKSSRNGRIERIEWHFKIQNVKFLYSGFPGVFFPFRRFQNELVTGLSWIQ